MLFKKKVTVEDYCCGKLALLFSPEREATWDSLWSRCNDAALNQADKNLYYDNLRAAMIELMGIAITKNCKIEPAIAARIYMDNYLKKRGMTAISSLRHDYNGAFGCSYSDGVTQMVQLFAERVTQSKMGEPTKQQFYIEFYGIWKMLFEEFKSIKLVAPTPVKQPTGEGNITVERPVLEEDPRWKEDKKEINARLEEFEAVEKQFDVATVIAAFENRPCKASLTTSSYRGRLDRTTKFNHLAESVLQKGTLIGIVGRTQEEFQYYLFAEHASDPARKEQILCWVQETDRSVYAKTGKHFRIVEIQNPKEIPEVRREEAWKSDFMNQMLGKYPLYLHRNEFLDTAQKHTEEGGPKSVAMSITSTGEIQLTKLNTEADSPFEDIPRIGSLHKSAAIVCVFFPQSGAQQLMSMTIAPDGRIASATCCSYEIINGKFAWGQHGPLTFGETTRSDFAWR